MRPIVSSSAVAVYQLWTIEVGIAVMAGVPPQYMMGEYLSCHVVVNCQWK